MLIHMLPCYLPGLIRCGLLLPLPLLCCSYDYGSSYIEENLGGVCLCGTDACKYKPQQTPEQLQEQVQQQQ